MKFDLKGLKNNKGKGVGMRNKKRKSFEKG